MYKTKVTTKNKTLKPTRFACTTDIGLKRKMDRMIAQELAARYPAIYDEIYNEAKQYCEFDQWSPTSRVQDVKVGKESVNHKVHSIIKKEQREAAIKEKFVPKYLGIQYVEVTREEE